MRSIRICLVLSVTIFFFGCLHGQDQILTYFRKDTLNIISGDSLDFIYGKYKKSKESIKERFIIANTHCYKFSVVKTKEGDVQQLTDSVGRLCATVLLYGDERFNVVLTDGTKFIYKYNETNWAYEKDGKKVIGAQFHSGKGQFKLKRFDPIVSDNEILQIAFLERCLYIVREAQYNDVANGFNAAKWLTLLRYLR